MSDHGEVPAVAGEVSAQVVNKLYTVMMLIAQQQYDEKNIDLDTKTDTAW